MIRSLMSGRGDSNSEAAMVEWWENREWGRDEVVVRWGGVRGKGSGVGWPPMKGDGEEKCGFRDFLSLGGSAAGSVRGAGEGGGEESLLASLSRNGLSMLAGGANGFSLKAAAVGNLSGVVGLRNLGLGGGGERATKVSGSGFTGFYRASVGQTAWPSAPMGLRFVSEETQGSEEAGASSSHRGIAGKLEQPLRTDVENLSPDECWKLILRLGKRWPAWNGITALQSLQGVLKDKSSGVEGVDRGHQKDERLGGNPAKLQIGEDSLKLLASRALEALAQAPNRHGRTDGSMLAPKLTTQEFLKTMAGRDPPTPSSQSAHLTLPVYQQSTSSAKPPISSSREMAAPRTSSAGPRTAPLTIFYAGTVNVCEDVPEDKARLIMLFAEKAGFKANTQAPARSASCAAPSTSASPQVTPQGSARPQEDLQRSKPSYSVLASGTVSVPSHLSQSATHSECFSSLQKPVESSSPAEMATAEPPPMPLTVTATEGTSRQQRQQQGPAKPLPNARKNSLARFLDSRKRNRPTGSSSEAQPSMRRARGPSSDGYPSDADDMKGSGKSPMPLCSQSSIDSKEGIIAMFPNDAEMKTEDFVTK